MQSVNIAELENNLRAYLEQVKNGTELIVKDRNGPVARLVPLIESENLLDAEERTLVAGGLMRLPVKVKSDDFFALPAPRVAITDVQAVIRGERDQD